MINLRPMTGGLLTSTLRFEFEARCSQARYHKPWQSTSGRAVLALPASVFRSKQSRRLAAMGYAGQHQAVAQGQQRAVEHQRAAAGFRSWLAQTPAMCAGQSLAGQIVRCATLRPIATGMQSIVFDPTHPNNLPFPVKRGARVPAVGLSASSGLCRYHQVRRPENPPPGTAACILADASDRTRADTFPSVIRLAFFPSRAPAG